MKRHDTDLISLVSGVLFAALGVLFALDAVGTYHVDLSIVPAIVFLVFGIGISASVLASARTAAPQPAVVEADPVRDEGPQSEG